MPDIAQLSVKVTADVKQVKQGLKDVDDQVKATSGWKNILGDALGIFGGFSLANMAGQAVGFLKDQLSETVQAGMDANRMDALLAAGLKSTGDASGQSVSSLQHLSDTLSTHTGITSEAVKGAEQMLLTFTGLGKDVFPQATQAVADMATRMNGGAIPSAQQMNDTALQLGKALNDPVKGLTMLQREGVTFTDQQKAQITAMEKAGNTAGAQAIMLKELQKEFGGSAAAAGQANGGIAILQASLDNAREEIGQAMIPVLDSLLSAITPLVLGFADNLPSAIATAQAFFAQLQPGIQVTGAVLGFIKDRLGDLGSAIQQQGPIIQGLEALFAGIAATLTGKLLVAFVQSIPELAAQAAAWLADAAASGAAAIAELAAEWPVLAIGAAIGGLILIIKLLIDHWGQVTDALGNFKDVLGTVLGAIGDFVGGILGFFGNLFDELIGHSIIPDLINGIVTWFTSLPGKVLGLIGTMVGNLLGTIGTMKDQAIALAMKLATDFVGPGGIGGLPAQLLTLAGQMLDGLIQGILGGAANVLSTVKDFAGSIVDGIKGVLGIHSPSTVFAGIGADSASGYAQGLSSGTGKASAAAQSVAKAATDSMASPQNLSNAYDAGAALSQALADGSYSVSIQENINANIAAAQQGQTGGKGGPHSKHFAGGGLIPEPVVGYGTRSGTLYTFAENGPEMVVPNGHLPNLYASAPGSAASASSGAAGGGSGVYIAPGTSLVIPLQVNGRTFTQVLLPDLVSAIRQGTGGKTY